MPDRGSDAGTAYRPHFNVPLERDYAALMRVAPAFTGLGGGLADAEAGGGGGGRVARAGACTGHILVKGRSVLGKENRAGNRCVRWARWVPFADPGMLTFRYGGATLRRRNGSHRARGRVQ
jgi:hypothetical protein